MNVKRVLIITLPLVLACLLVVFLVVRERHLWLFESCDNHSTFLANAMGNHASKHGWLPYVKGMENDKALCTLDSMWTEAHINCNLGAPDDMKGGWQYIHAPPRSWEAILVSLEGSAENVPVAWCGKPHQPYWPSGRKARKVVALQLQGFKPREYLHARNSGEPGPAKPEEYVWFRPHEMEDDALIKILSRINDILARCGDTPIHMDIRE